MRSDFRKIGIFRALQLGDMLCAIPALRALRTAFPEAEIILLGLPWSAFLVKRFPEYFDDFIHFPGYPGLPEQKFDPAKFSDFLRTVQEEHFDLILQMQGNGNLVNPMVELFGAAQTGGFFKQDIYYPADGLFIEYPEGIHETERHLKLIENLGATPQGNFLEFPIFDIDRKEIEDLNLSLSEKGYVCVHPGSRGAWRQWPPEYFALLGDQCADAGFTVIITGTSDELDIVNSVAGFMKNDSVILAGKTSLGAIGALINDAKILISNCTGVSHIAAATETPSIVISMDGEPERWAPLNRSLHYTIDWTKTQKLDPVIQALDELIREGRISN